MLCCYQCWESDTLMISFLLEKKIILSLYLYPYKWFQIALYCNIFLYFFLQYFFSNTNLWQSTGFKKKKFLPMKTPLKTLYLV